MNICLNFYTVKCKMLEIWMIEKLCMFSMFLVAIVQISMECETQES